MKESFKEYYKPTEKEFKYLWDNCEFIFDANVLLNIYRYSLETTEEFLDVLMKVQDRIWLPHQAALEYQRNRFSVIEEQVTKCKKLENLLEKNEIITFLNENKRHPFIDAEFIFSEIEKTFKNLKDSLETNRNNYPNTISKDNLRDTITEIFDGKIGDEFSKKDLDNTYKREMNDSRMKFHQVLKIKVNQEIKSMVIVFCGTKLSCMQNQKGNLSF